MKMASHPPSQQHPPDCPFSVEVEACSSPGRLRLSQKEGWSLALCRKEVTSLITKTDGAAVESCCEDRHDHHRSYSYSYATPGGLVPVGSASESDDSFSVRHGEDSGDEDGGCGTQDTEQLQLLQSQSQEAHSLGMIVVATVDSLETVKTGGNTGASAAATEATTTAACSCSDSEGGIMFYDCLADQIASLFCPTDHHKGGGGSGQDGSSSAASLSSAASHPIVAATTCGPDLNQLFQSPNGEDESSLFFTSAFNFWLTPSQEEAIKSRNRPPPVPRPGNRSATSHRRRDCHVRRLCDTWHPPTEQMPFVLQRSKSWTAAPNTGGNIRPRSSTSSSSSSSSSREDYYYDSDPGQECRGRRGRMAALIRPEEEPDRLQRRYRRFQPASIDCGGGAAGSGFHNDNTASSSTEGSSRSLGTITSCSSSGEGGGNNNNNNNNDPEDHQRLTHHHDCLGGGTTTASDGSTSYETARTNHRSRQQPLLAVASSSGMMDVPTFPATTATPPPAPRNSDRPSPFGFGRDEPSSSQQGGGEASAEAAAVTTMTMTMTMTASSRGDSCGSELSSLGDEESPAPGDSAAVAAKESSDQHQRTLVQPRHSVAAAAASSSFTSASSSSNAAANAAASATTTSSATTMSHTSRTCPAYFRSPTHWTEFNLLYSNMDDLTKAYVQELSNVRFPLIWHPRADTAAAVGNGGAKKRGGNSSPAVATGGGCSAAPPPLHAHPCPTTTPAPMAVHGVFEVGAHLEHMVVQPKFTWSPVIQPDLLGKRRLALSGSQPNSVELLSIIRVNKPSAATTGAIAVDDNVCTVDRNVYPFPRLDRTVCITTNDRQHPHLVLEAPSPAERDWLVVALKLIVARLASIIIVRDEEMLLEFFSPYAALMQLEPDEVASSASSSSSSSAPAATTPGPVSAGGGGVVPPDATEVGGAAASGGPSRRRLRRRRRPVRRRLSRHGPPTASTAVVATPPAQGSEDLLVATSDEDGNDDAGGCREEEATEDDEMITDDDAADTMSITDDDFINIDDDDDAIADLDEGNETDHDEESRQGPASTVVDQHLGPTLDPAITDAPLVTIV